MVVTVKSKSYGAHHFGTLRAFTSGSDSNPVCTRRAFLSVEFWRKDS